MIVNGWQLVQDKLFTEQLNKLIAEVTKVQQTQPESFKEHPKTKRLARIYKLMLEEIPCDPAHPQWNQGNTLGEDFRF